MKIITESVALEQKTHNIKKKTLFNFPATRTILPILDCLIRIIVSNCLAGYPRVPFSAKLKYLGLLLFSYVHLLSVKINQRNETGMGSIAFCNYYYN